MKKKHNLTPEIQSKGGSTKWSKLSPEDRKKVIEKMNKARLKKLKWVKKVLKEHLRKQ